MTHRLPLVLLATPLFWGQAIFAQADLQGIWSNATITPLERPADLAGKPTFTPEEAAAYEKQVVERNNVDHRTGNADADVATAYNQFWYDRGTKAVGTRRTSLIVDPPDGHLPALTPEGQNERMRSGNGCRNTRPTVRRAARWANAVFCGPQPGPRCFPAHTTITSKSYKRASRW